MGEQEWFTHCLKPYEELGCHSKDVEELLKCLTQKKDMIQFIF